jgi:DMSO/TMAO reductase YedYZ molybdopterin-dependent catalytic subunit
MIGSGWRMYNFSPIFGFTFPVWTASHGRSSSCMPCPRSVSVTRLICVEGWNMIGKRTGTPLRIFLERVGADLTAKYAGFECADGYYEGIDMPTALHPQTIMAFSLSGQTLPTKYGYPFKIRTPTKPGFKNPKFVTTFYVTNRRPRGFWTDRGYNWFSGI